MQTLSSIRLWMRALLRRRDVQQDLDREMHFHLEMEAEKNRRAGLSPDEARRRARIAFGGVDKFREAVADERGVRPIEDLAGDLRYAIRGLRRAPAFTTMAVVILGLGIGATTAVATIVEHVLREALPYRQSDRLVFLTEATAKGEDMLTSFPNFDDWRRRSKSFVGLTAFGPINNDAVVVGTVATRARIQGVSREFFAVLGAHPVIGRPILAAENTPGGPPVAVVSERFWRSISGAARLDSTATLKLYGSTWSVIGVMPPDFRVIEDADVWIATETQPVMVRGAGNYWVIGRLRPGATVDGARRDMNAVAAQLKREFGDRSISSTVFMTPLLDRVVGGARRPLLILFGAALFVLVVTAASIALMQMARSSSREHELAIRAALGAGRFRLVRQLATEQLVLAAVGCAAGIVLAWVGIAGVQHYGVGVLPRLDEVRLDGLVLAFAIGASILAIVVFGLAPVARLIRRPSLATARSVRARAHAGRRGGSVLVTVQAAVTVLLIVGAALLARSVYKVMTVDLGYDRRGLMSVSVRLTSGRYNNLQTRLAAAERIRDALRGIPTVDEVALTTQLPNERGGNRGPILVPPFGDPNAQASWSTSAPFRVVTPNYFSVMRIRLLEGRVFDATDGPQSKAVVINHTLAQKLWPRGDALGKQLRALADPRGDTLTVVGIVAEARDWRSVIGTQQELFLALDQGRPQSLWVVNAVMRTSSSVPSIMAEVQRRVRQIDAELAPVSRTLDAAVADSIADRRFIGGVILTFAVVVLALTLAGVFGSVAYTVDRRTREIGIRMAVGASRREVWLMVQRRTLVSAMSGGAIGLVAAIFAGKVLSSLLYGVSAHDAIALVLAPVITMAAIAVAASIPAFRATRIDPVSAIRSE